MPRYFLLGKLQLVAKGQEDEGQEDGQDPTKKQWKNIETATTLFSQSSTCVAAS